MPEKRELRYAHSEGQSDLCYDERGDYIVTGGAEGDVRVWSKDGDYYEAESHHLGDRILSIAVSKGKIYSAIENNTVQIHTFPECSPDGFATRFTAPVNHLALSGDRRWLAAGASDFHVKVICTDENKQRSFVGHSAPVLSVALDRDAEFLASSSCDATVKIWDVEMEKCVHTIENILPKKCSDVTLSKVLCRMAFQGKNLLVPIGKEVHQYNRKWEKTRSFDCSAEASIVSFSHCGKFMAVALLGGGIQVWNFEKKSVVLNEKHPDNLGIQALKWHPKKHQLSYCDTSGQFGQIDDVTSVANDEDDGGNDDGGLTAEQYANLFDDDDDVDFSKIHEKAAEKAAKAKDSDADSDMDEGDINEALVDMSDGESEAPPRPEPMSDDDDASVASEKPQSKPVIVQSHADCYKPTPLQRPFQSKSTSVHLSQRFMVWNSVGIVRQYRTDEENTIDVEFHDSSLHHRMTVPNEADHVFADISTEAVVLANEEGLLLCMHFSTWDSTKEWSVSTPKGERITALTLGQGFVAIATDKRKVRLFSIGGLQTHLFSVAGPVLTLSGHSDKLIVVYHSGTGVPGDQNLSMKLLDIQTKSGLETALPLTPKSTLAFIGFSDEGSAFAMDSHGIFRMLNRRFGQTWIQVLNTGDHAKGKTDGYWIVGISESLHQVRCILCKGAQYPQVLPRPTLSLLPFRIPLCEQEKSMIEENYFKSQLALNFLDEIDNEEVQKGNDLMEREALMKLFALSCKQGHEFRAYEVCKLMPDYQTVQLAIKYASRLHLIQLAEKLNELARMKIDEEIQKMRGKNDEDDDERENEKPDDTGDEVEEIRGPMLIMKKNDTPKSLLSSQNEERKNPFKTSKERLSVGKGSSIFDELKEGNKQTSNKSPFGRATVELKKTTVAKKPKQKEFFTSKDEKQVWQEKAKSGGDGAGDGKRKRDEESELSESKKLCT